MTYTLDHIARIIGSDSSVRPVVIEQLLLDSRKVYSPAGSLFFALKGPRRDGHRFIPELYKKGVRNFVVSEPVSANLYPEANFVQVKDSQEALQQLAASHRSQFSIPVIGITGSNGKTIVKEWLYQLLQEDFTIVRSPRSYNSQIGVPLSIWQMNEQHGLGIFEAGISTVKEMEKLEAVIRPTIGVLTNIGDAHNEGFSNKEEKFREKILLFRHAEWVVCHSKYKKEGILSSAIKGRLFTWGTEPEDDVRVISIDKYGDASTISLNTKVTENGTGDAVTFSIPFTDDASIENAILCYSVCYLLGTDAGNIASRLKDLYPVEMRLQLKKAINNSYVINDSYSADLSSLEIALNFLSQQGMHTKRTVILSDFVQTGMQDKALYAHIYSALKKHGVTRVIGIGEKIMRELDVLQQKEDTSLSIELYPSTPEFIAQFRSSRFRDETILVKGARVFAFEEIVLLLEQKVHQTLLEINLNAIASNLKEYQRFLEPSTKIMAMVKAFAYGSGGAEIAGVLQYHKVDYLGVAYADEGVDLRKAGITLPIMVLNPEETTFNALAEYSLEPDIYSPGLLQSFDLYLKKEGIRQYPVHIEIETGMNRLGFDVNEMDMLSAAIKQSSSFKIQTVFSHLTSSEDPKDDDFTFKQLEKFLTAAARLENNLGYSFLKHIGNSAAALRHAALQLDMVRLGIGLYGIDSADTHKAELQPVATLKSTIAQLKHVAAGESVSYNRKGIVKRDSLIATVRIGYADGFSRRLGNGVASMYVKGKPAPVTGTVCMDMTMIDVTDIEGVNEGDEVIIFGKELPIQQLAEWADTIPYEIMTGISQRVKRVYFEE